MLPEQKKVDFSEGLFREFGLLFTGPDPAYGQGYALDGVSQCRGFTLFELIISLTIVSVMLVLIFGTLRLGVRAWDRGERDLVLNQEERVVLEMIKYQISSLKQAKFNETSLDDSFTLAGDEKSFAFFSNFPLMPANSFGYVFVKYQVIDEDNVEKLYLFEKSGALITQEDITISGDDPELLIPLVTQMKSISFEYLKRDEDAGLVEWQDQWDPDNDKALPAAVRVTFLDIRREYPLSIVARIRVDDESS